MASERYPATNPLRSEQATRQAVLAITGIAFYVRLVNLTTQSLWRDEIDSILLSSLDLKYLPGSLFITGHNGPLYFILLRFWRNLAGDSEFALRYPSALFGTLAVPLGYNLARHLGFSRRVGLLLSLLLATAPYLVWYGQEAKMYSLLMALVMGAILAYLKALSGAGRKWWGLFVILTTISYYIHILAPLMLIVYGVIAGLYPAYLRQQWRAGLISMACLTLPYIPLALWQSSFLMEAYQSGHSFYPLPDEIHLLLQLYSSGLIRFGSLAPFVLYVFLLLSGLLLGEKAGIKRQPPARSRYLVAVWLLLPPLLVYLISLRVPVFEDRYLIYVTPAFYLLVAAGLAAVRQHWRWLAGLALGLILIINLMGLWQQQRQPIKADFRAAAQYLLDHPQPPDTIMMQIPYLRHTWGYYYPRKHTLLEGLWTNDGKSEATVDVEMTGLTANLTDLWLVVSEEEMWDNRGLTRAWLDEHAELVDKAHFMRVDLYHYRLRPGLIESQSIDTTLE